MNDHCKVTEYVAGREGVRMKYKKPRKRNVQMSPRLEKLAQFIIESEGATTAEIGRYMGLTGGGVDSALKDLAYWCYLWQDGKGGKHYIDYMFDRSVEGTRDIFVAIFGKPLHMPKRDPSIDTWTAIEEEHPEDTGILRYWRIESNGFGRKHMDQILRRNRVS